MHKRTRIHRIMLSVAVCASWAALCLAEPATKPAKEYRIKIHRPEKADQVFKVTAFATTKHSRGGQEDQGASFESRRTCEFKGTRKVLKADANGLPVRNEMTCDSCIAEKDGNRKDLVPAGTVVIISNEDGKVKAEPKDPNVTLASDARDPILMATFVLPVPGLDLDAWFGTDKPRKVGESWPINADAIKAAIQKAGDKTDGQNITGRVTLVGLTKVEGVECLDVNIELDVTLSGPRVRDSSTTERNDTNTTFRLALPLDESIPLVSRKMKMVSDYAVKVSLPNVPESRLESRHETTIDVTSLPVSK